MYHVNQSIAIWSLTSKLALADSGRVAGGKCSGIRLTRRWGLILYLHIAHDTCLNRLCEPELWNLGHKLFLSTPQTFPVPLIEGNILNPAFITPLRSMTVSPSERGVLPDLGSLKSLNPLRGRISAIFTGAFFHLFTFEQQQYIAECLATLLSPEPGSILIGVQGGMAEKGLFLPDKSEYKMCCHSPKSWEEMWLDAFRQVTGSEGEPSVQVSASLRKEIGGLSFFDTWPNNTKQYYVLEWAVIRM